MPGQPDVYADAYQAQGSGPPTVEEVAEAVPISGLSHLEIPIVELDQITFPIDDERASPVNTYKMSLMAMSRIIAGEARLVQALAHGQPALAGALPRPVRTAAGSIVAANSAAEANYPVAYIVEIPDPNFVVLQTSGMHFAPGHGMQTSTQFYLQGNGSVASTPGPNKVPVWFTWDSNWLVLQQPPAP